MNQVEPMLIWVEGIPQIPENYEFDLSSIPKRTMDIYSNRPVNPAFFGKIIITAEGITYE